ncbi:SGNH/GDSL hydrolase family protein [Rossellomorea aquimaris]|uniref:SGNH/GDSL hydrolase family protein n=1 Tax=Rossellomorea aquimaris TaxID=189382 RepID=A0A5D4U3K0_9BACI|nr:SGNH/GDSL hydrolase family protein [Rossellomorea aquimaris]TYS81895.1 SGNH/GDSL hydrolase family protein [Rossellomorea aquimaris]TYS88519.1 SGNH/GDSL hydrolase family protein [Rossellomorea aquimaris]
MKKWMWQLFITLSLALTVLFGYGFVRAYWDVANPPQEKILAESEEAPVTPGETYIALGDSLTRGVGSSKGEGFVPLVGNPLKETNTVERYQNLGIRGARIEDLLAQLEQKDVKRSLKDAKIISITIGGNNLFNSGEILNNYSETTALGILETEIPNLEKTFETIRDINKDAVILYMGLYNPFKELPDGDSFDSVIQKWNESARTLGLKYEVHVVDTFNLVTDAKRDLSSDNFHPNDATYQQIADSLSLVIEKNIIQ